MKPICPECESQNILFRKKTNSLYCRRCGYEWKRKLRKINVAKRKKVI